MNNRYKRGVDGGFAESIRSRIVVLAVLLPAQLTLIACVVRNVHLRKQKFMEHSYDNSMH